MKKKIVLFIIIGLLLSTTTIVTGQNTAQNLAKTCEDIIPGLIQQLDESMVLGYLENITSFGPRVTGTQACKQAGIYIFNEFQSMGLEVRYHNWTGNFGLLHGSNIEATLPGTDENSDEIYIICAHYDSWPFSPGANDDASGVAAVMSAAYLMRQYSFNHTIRFITFSGEEQAMIGSSFYAEDAYNNDDNIIVALNADMIGYAETEDGGNKIRSYLWKTSPWVADLIADVSQQYFQYINLDVIETLSPFAGPNSDYISFAEFGYDALLFIEYEGNFLYHTPQDIIANMNLTYTTKASKLIIAALAEFARLPVTINLPPNKPAKPNGPTSGEVGTIYEYTTSTTDPDEHHVKYGWDFDGDLKVDHWMAYYPSGDTVTMTRRWNIGGSYEIRVKAKDIRGGKSEWSDPLVVSMPVSQPSSQPSSQQSTTVTSMPSSNPSNI